MMELFYGFVLQNARKML